MNISSSYFLLVCCCCCFFLTPSTARTVTRVDDKDHVDGELNEQNRRKDARIPFSLEETYTADFLALNFNGTWKSDTEIVYTDAWTGDAVKFNILTGKKTVIIDALVLFRYNQVVYSLSPSSNRVLIGHDSRKGFRHSVFRKYVVYDIEKRTHEEIGNGSYIPLARWTPLNDNLVYVADNDIYYKRFSEKHEEVRRITNTGIPGIIYNGVADWVYEEEVLHSSSATWYSPTGSHLAFMTFNDTGVKEISYFHYGEPGSLVDQYPTEMKIKYPKAGTTNPIVTLTLVNLDDPTVKPINLKAPVDVVGTEYVLRDVTWIATNHIVATWMNRVQNRAQFVQYNLEGESTNMLHLEETEGWLEVSSIHRYGNYIFLVKMQLSGTEAGRFPHLTRYKYYNGKLYDETDLTPGSFEVHRIRAIDFINKRIYYLATAPGEPSQRNLYFVPLLGTRKPSCVSCDILTPEGNNCTYVDASFSPLRTYYALCCYGPDPTTVDIYNKDRRKVQPWYHNPYLRRKLSQRKLPLIKNLSVKANGYDCNVRLYLPPDFDEGKTYPMLVNVYGGPNTARITDVANYGFHMYMTTNRSVIYTFIDGRGSSFKGSKMLFEIFRRFGTVEIEDQIAVTRILQNTYSWIDSARTAIWGWSYGGFSSAMALSTDKDSIFKCAISVAPVSSWIYYDSIYTERYMGLPTEEDNIYGYNGTDVTRRVEGMRGKKFMLIHGTSDDNVHFQQAMALAKALEHADIQFEQVTYTDEAHALSGVSPHLYHTMDRFWGECFGLSHGH